MERLDLKEALKRAKDVAEKSWERRLFVFLGVSGSDIIAQEIADYLNDETLIITDDENWAKLFGKGYIVKHKETKSILGRTFSNAVIDLRYDLDVISLSRGVETVRGGGLIFLFLPFRYTDVQRKYFEKLKPLGIKESPRDILRRRILIKALRSEGAYVFSLRAKDFIKIPEERPQRKTSERTISPPKDAVFDKRVYELCLTKDQIKVIRAFEKLAKREIDAILVTADRGRGKSASVGLGLVGLSLALHTEVGRPLQIVITSPEPENSLEIFRFIKRGLEALGIRYVENQLSVKSPILRAEYKEPYEAKYAEPDVLVADEAAGIQFPILRDLLRKKALEVFVTTIHGYEGSGRMFSVRFLPLLKETKNTLHVELEEPIRYAEGDPVERWLFDSLMLDAEPADVDEGVLEELENVKYERVKPHVHFIGKGEDVMKEAFGILVSAHYRNNPNDLLFLADAPHHIGYIGLVKERPIVAVEVSREGSLSEEEIQEFLVGAPSSHIIPDKLLKYYGMYEFMTFEGWRIVRIAVHPQLMRCGIGSRTLKFIEEEARRNGVRWVGAGFTGYPELLSFWLKNEYIPVHVSPKLNKRTGEHTVIVVKSLDDKIKKLIVEANKELKKRLLAELSTTYRNLDERTALLILKSGEPIGARMLNLSKAQAFRLKLYMEETLHLESASDAVYELVKFYFSRGERLLREEEELLLVAAVLQRKKVGIRRLLEVRRIVKRLWRELITVRYEKE